MDRYDGPDVEGEVAGRVAGNGMTAVMVTEGLMAGLATRTERGQVAQAEQSRQLGEQAAAVREATREADRARWSAVTSDPGLLPGWDGEQLGQAWTAAVRWPDDRQADRARVAVEAELRERDPGVHARYAGLRACGHEPGEAMRRTLTEHHQQLEQHLSPLLAGPRAVAGMDDAGLWESWSAAEACATPVAGQARAAARAEAERRGGPPWGHYQSLLPVGPRACAHGSLVADAAAAAGYRFHPGHLNAPAWTRVAAAGVPPVVAPAPSVPAVARTPLVGAGPGQPLVVLAAATRRGQIR